MEGPHCSFLPDPLANMAATLSLHVKKKKKEIYNDKYRHTRDRLFGLHLYLSATLKQCFTEFAVCRTTFHHVDMSVRGRIPTCDLIGRLFLGSELQRMCLLLVK